MTRIGYDAINPDNLPAGGDLYLGYDDGNWPDESAIEAKFPDKTVIKITVNPNDNQGIVGDGPPDNGTWPQWVGWVQKRRAAGVDPTINTNSSNWVAGQSAFNAAGVAQPHWWIAHYSNNPPDLNNLPAIPTGAVGLQCFDYGSYDISVFNDYWPGVDPKPDQTTTPTDEEDDMQNCVTSNPTTGRAGLGFAEGACTTFQITADKGQVNSTTTFRFVAVLDSGPDVIAESQTMTNGKAVVHLPAGITASGIIVTTSQVGLEFELYAQ